MSSSDSDPVCIKHCTLLFTNTISNAEESATELCSVAKHTFGFTVLRPWVVAHTNSHVLIQTLGTIDVVRREE